ncbi:sodium:solute symporter family protein [Rubellicoccus peritrichatus]|uniref:Transporter n=1 Tax=Rubellicoccus peritrichatus TaxID=3080537 RepID=A0AAQ3QT82_9BACT|nr:hypothetical protein [Puniceicoccus sp. CR14]WOO41041.1 hypothetical protein RZN69_20670 [Puniceicoccus sp. CR14]
MTLEYITLAIYLAVLLILGAYFKRFNKNLSDFVRGGAQGSWWLIGMSILMSSISAFTFTGNASAAFEGGPSLLVIYVANCVGFALGAWFIGPWLRQTRAYTVPDVIRMRFGTSVEQFQAIFGVFLGPLAAALQLYALSIFASTVLGLPLVPVLISIGVIVTFYSTTGGKWAVMATDFVQAMVMLSITVLVCILSLNAVGGLSNFFAYFQDPEFKQSFRFFKEPGEFPGDRYTITWAIMAFLMQINAQISLSSAGRYIAARDGREASRASWFSFIIMALGSAIWFIPPMVTRFLYGAELMESGLENPTDASYAFIAMKLLPNGLVGMLIAAMFAATMSSMDTGLNLQAGVIVRNIIPWLRRLTGKTQPLAQATEMRICHFATVCLGVIIISYALLFTMQKDIPLFDAMLLVTSIVGIPMAFPLFLGLWLKKLPKWSFFPIFVACLLPSIWSFIDAELNGAEWTIQARALWIFAFGTIACIVSLCFRKYSSEKAKAEVDEFYTLMHTPISYDKEVGNSAVDYEQYFLISKAVIVVGLLVLLILIVPNSLNARLSILCVATTILSIGAILWYGGSRIQKQRNQK